MENFTDTQKQVIHDILDEKQSAWQKRLSSLPVVGPLLAGFGLVSTLYGFEKLLDQTTLINHPWILLAIGVCVLLFTGAYYRKL